MRDDTRAQTPLDFAIAMGIFLVAVTFVFTFIPSMTTPFVEGNQDRSVTADRVAGHLTEDALGSPDERVRRVAEAALREVTRHAVGRRAAVLVALDERRRQRRDEGEHERDGDEEDPHRDGEIQRRLCTRVGH